jgi:hypothetical protein
VLFASTDGNYTNNFTMMAWVYIDAMSTSGLGHRVFSKRSSGAPRAYEWYVESQGSSVGRLTFYDGATTFTGASSAIAQGAWTHVAVVINGASSQFYVNGVASGSAFNPSAITLNSTALMMGNYAITPTFAFPGKIFDARVYGSALSAADIILAMNFQPLSTLPAIWLKCDDNNATIAYDSSGNARHGTKTNVTASTFTELAAWTGSRTYSVVAIDGAGNRSTAATVTIEKYPPGAPQSFRADE